MPASSFNWSICNSSCKNINIYLLTATIGDIIVQTIQTKMPICVSYLTNTMPIIWDVGGGTSLIFVIANGKYWVPFRQYLCRYFNFCQCKCCLNFVVKTPAEGCLFYGQINNIQLNINIKLKILIPLRYQFNVQVKLADLSGAGDGLPL